MAQPIATLRQKCEYCGKDAVERKRRVLGKKLIITLECGHVIFQQQLATTTLKAVEQGKTQEQLEIEEAMKYASSDGKHAYPYQIRSVKFFEQCGLNGICAHEMGVGKMVIECLLLKRNEEEVTPTLFVVKSGLRYQAWLEIVRWTGMIPQIIESGRELPYTDIFPIVIISYDTLRLVRPDVTREWEMQNAAGQNGKGKGKAKNVLWTDEVCAQFKHIVMDECQMIKNPDASRTRAIKKIASAWQRVEGGKAPRIMGMSGTPIKNDASEYATILHMVNPTMFPSETGFIARDCYPIGSGNRYKLLNPDRFHEKTKGFIQRFTREEVLPELPAINRMFLHAELEGDALTKYMEVVKEFQELMDKIDEISMRDITNILGYFSRMRRITGGAKVDSAFEWVEEFLLSCERKVVIFVHHKDTGKLLYQKLLAASTGPNGEKLFEEPLMLTSALSMQQRQEVVNQFKGVEMERVVAEDGSIQMVERPTGKNHRILIASTQAAGEGLNLQFCADCMIMERQWNPANEEQAEARFPRPGQLADKISVTYLIAAGSIDDFLTELVERKRAIMHSTLDNVEVEWDESSLIKDLAHTLQVKGLKKWSV
jgi:SNF2 family DNA or RNA helicase